MLQLALHFWYLHHSEQNTAGSEVLKAAHKMNLSPGGTFDPRKGIAGFGERGPTRRGRTL